MKRESMFFATLLLLACLGVVFASSQRPRMKPMTDGISHTSGETGKWVKGCSPGQECNMGVGNLGEANTYHWVD